MYLHMLKYIHHILGQTWPIDGIDVWHYGGRNPPLMTFHITPSFLHDGILNPPYSEEFSQFAPFKTSWHCTEWRIDPKFLRPTACFQPVAMSLRSPRKPHGFVQPRGMAWYDLVWLGWNLHQKLVVSYICFRLIVGPHALPQGAPNRQKQRGARDHHKRNQRDQWIKVSGMFQSQNLSWHRMS